MQEKINIDMLTFFKEPSVNLKDVNNNNSLDRKEFEKILNNLAELNDKNKTSKIKDIKKAEDLVNNFLCENNIINLSEITLKEMLNLLFDVGFYEEETFDFEALKEMLLEDNDKLTITKNNNTTLIDNQELELFKNYLVENKMINSNSEMADIINNNEKTIENKESIGYLDKSKLSEPLSNIEKNISNDLDHKSLKNINLDNNNLNETKSFLNEEVKLNINDDNNLFEVKSEKKVMNLNIEKVDVDKESIKLIDNKAKVQTKNIFFEDKMLIKDIKIQTQNIQNNNLYVDNSDNIKPLEIKNDSDILKIADYVQISKIGNKTKLTVQLIPAELGKINIQLHEVHGKINAKIFVESDHIKSMLLQHSDAIKNQLSEKGIVIDNMDFEFMDSSSDKNAYSNGGHQQNTKKITFNNDDLKVETDNIIDKSQTEERIYA
jgi:flagellar hook-length control protein FliK